MTQGSEVVSSSTNRDETYETRDSSKRKAVSIPQASSAQREKFESLGLLAEGIAHDFNNFLTGIAGNADLMLMNLPEDDPRREFARNIKQIVSRASSLSGQVLQYTSNRGGEHENINLNGLVQEMSSLLRTSLSSRCRLEMMLQNPLPEIRGNEAEVFQVVMNLMVNASESLDDGKGCISLMTGAIEADRCMLESMPLRWPIRPGRYVYLTVRDNGCGMDDRTLDRIFEPFFSTKQNGRGLGMATVINNLRKHAGGLCASSRAGEGTTFQVLLPAADAPEQAGGEQTQLQEASGKLRPQKGKILVVDDDELIRGMLKTTLKHYGFEIIQAADGVEGVAAYERNHADLDAVILDMMMPRLNGEEALRQMKQISPTVPVLLCSGFAQGNLTDRFADLGPTGFIKKPFHTAGLVAELERTFSAAAEQ
jgi:nitrogen-specific signal transduction histidine kinase/ActR/RegA family two-component response regulator